MYITINDVIGEKRIDLSYPISSGKDAPVEIAVITMLSDNVQYLLKESMKIRLKSGEDVALKKGVYMDKELNAIIGLELKLAIESCDYVLRTNKLEYVTEMAISLEELDIAITSKMESPATPYLHIILLVLNILHILNQKCLNIRNSTMVRSFL